MRNSGEDRKGIDEQNWIIMKASELDIAKDMYSFALIGYLEHDCYETKERMEWWRNYVKYLMMKEYDRR